MYRHYSYLAPQAYYPPGQPMNYEPPAPVPQRQPPNGTENITQASYAEKMLQRLTQGSSMAAQPLGQPHAPLAPGVGPSSAFEFAQALARHYSQSHVEM